MESDAKKIMEFLLGPQKFSVFYRGVSVFQLMKVPLTKHVEALYIQSGAPLKSETGIAERRFPQLNTSLYNIGIIVDHKAVYSEAVELRSLLDDTDEILPWSVCVFAVEEGVQQAVLDRLSRRKLPALTGPRIQEAERRAVQAAEDGIEPASNFGSLHQSYVLDDAIVDCLSNTQGWAEKIAKNWLSKPKNVDAMLHELTVVKAARELVIQAKKKAG